MFKLILKDSEWLRGKYAARNSYLFRPEDGRRCCLGVLGKERGIPSEVMECVCSFAETSKLRNMAERDKMLSWTTDVIDDDTDAQTAMQINDNQLIDDEERVIQLRPIFARHGIEVEFRENE